MAHWWSAPANKAGRFPLENAVLPVIWFSRASSLEKRSSGEALGWPVVCVSAGDGEAAFAGWGREATFLAEGITSRLAPGPLPSAGRLRVALLLLPRGYH